ncbi:hypothetical protein, partial [Salmonella enterica]|uniref:hypothetical protein n=4 Tax=Salmonella enterica TaxID=28901 RepID=UPI001C387C71
GAYWRRSVDDSSSDIVLFGVGFCASRLLSMENPQLGWGFRKAFSFKPVIKTPFDLLKHLAVWQLQKFNKKSKGGPNGGRKELSAHPMEL